MGTPPPSLVNLPQCKCLLDGTRGVSARGGVGFLASTWLGEKPASLENKRTHPLALEALRLLLKRAIQRNIQRFAVYDIENTGPDPVFEDSQNITRSISRGRQHP